MKEDGIYNLLPRKDMTESAKKLRDIYAVKPNAPLFQREFGFYSLERWQKEGKISKNHTPWSHDNYFKDLFGFDEPGAYHLAELGWTEPAYFPEFNVKLIEDRGKHEVVQDKAGRHVLYFKGRRQGFMPEYLDHPVKDKKTWEENCKWRLDPETPERYEKLNHQMKTAKNMAQQGKIITQQVIGGYMYLRSLIGPEDLLYKFYDDPELIHDCMETWLKLADTITAKHQQHITIDELFFGEDICYNNGPLISPDMIREFLFPYYQQLIKNIKKRQLDKDRHLYFQLDTDGDATTVIPLYQEIGMDVMSPFEVASGCDVVKIGKQYPNLVILGGIDKRILAKGKKAIDDHLNYILPAMKKRGGYIPTCDHGVPEEVDFDNYLYYRQKCLELG